MTKTRKWLPSAFESKWCHHPRRKAATKCYGCSGAKERSPPMLGMTPIRFFHPPEFLCTTNTPTLSSAATGCSRVLHVSDSSLSFHQLAGLLEELKPHRETDNVLPWTGSDLLCQLFLKRTNQLENSYVHLRTKRFIGFE
jgi:hypothetical protein